MSGKYIHILLLSLCLHSVTLTYSQNKTIDSLNAVRKPINDSTEVKRLNALSSEYFNIGNYDSILSISSRAAKIANQIEYKKGEAIALIDLGWCYYSRNNYSKATEYSESALKISHSAGYKNGIGHVFLLVASINLIQGNYDTARHFIENALTIFNETNNLPGKANALSTLGNLYTYQSDPEKALASFLESSKIYESLGYKKAPVSVYLSIADYYSRLKEFDKARSYFNKLLKIYSKSSGQPDFANAYVGIGNIYLDERILDSALYYFNKAKSIFENLGDKYSLGIVTNNIGDVYRFRKDYDKAITSYKTSLKICEEINDQEGMVYPMDGLGVIYTMKGNFNLAADYLNRSRKVSEDLGVLNLLSDNYLHSSQLDSARQNFKDAYEWHKKYSHIKDSLHSSQNSKHLAEMQSRFETEKKDQEIKYLNEEKKLKEEQQKKERNSYITLLTISVLFIGALLYIVVQTIKTGKILKLQKNEISQKNEELNQINEELKTVLETIEDQNKVLADKNQKLEELHQEKDGLIGIVAHDLRSPLTKTTGLIELITMSGPINQQQNELVDMIKKVCQQGNSLINDLLEIKRIEGNFEQDTEMSEIELSSFLDAFALHHIPIGKEKNIQIILEKNFKGNLMVNTNAEYLTRILDNLVSNALKFSPKETIVTIKSYTLEKYVFVSVSDQGPGISEEDQTNLFKKFNRLSARPTGGESSTGLGLSIVKTLAERLKGHIKVESELGKGSTFTLVFPISLIGGFK